MEVIKKGQSQVFHNGAITSYEYASKNKKINIGLVEIKGRHPQQDFVTNREVTELVYVIDGSVELTTESNKYSLSSGDFVIISPKEKYFFEGNCTVLTPCTPPWNSEQIKIIK